MSSSSSSFSSWGGFSGCSLSTTNFAAAAAATATFAVSMTCVVLYQQRLLVRQRAAPQQQQPPPQREDSLEEVQALRSKHFSSSVSVSYSNSKPLMMMGGQACHLQDSTGRWYLDTRNNVAHVGHVNPAVIAAVQRQVAQFNSNTRYLHPHVTRLAQQLTQLFPPSLEVVFLVNSGTEANDLALRLARAHGIVRQQQQQRQTQQNQEQQHPPRKNQHHHHQRQQHTIVVEGAYHGHSLATLQVSPYKYEAGHEKTFLGKQRQQHAETTTTTESAPPKPTEFQLQPRESPPNPSRPFWNPPTPSPYIWKVPCPDRYRGVHHYDPEYPANDRDKDDLGAYYASYVQDAMDAIATQHAGDTVGAFLVEGGMSVAGVVLPPPGYLEQAAAAVRRAGGLYIADEVQTGLGRLGGVTWAFQYQAPNNTPDIVTLGKPLGNGMALGAVVTTRTVAASFEALGVEYFNTFGGNPVCAAAGLAVLDECHKQQLPQHAQTVGNYLQRELQKLAQKCPLLGDIRGSGLFLGIELVRRSNNTSTTTATTTPPEPATREASYLCTLLKEKYAILTSIDGLHDNVLVVKPPLVFTMENAQELVQALDSAMREDLAGLTDKDWDSITKTPT